MEAQKRGRKGAPGPPRSLPQPPNTHCMSTVTTVSHCISGQRTLSTEQQVPLRRQRLTASGLAPATSASTSSSSWPSLLLQTNSSPLFPPSTSASSINHLPHYFWVEPSNTVRPIGLSHARSHPPSVASHSHSLPPYHSIAGGATTTLLLDSVVILSLTCLEQTNGQANTDRRPLITTHTHTTGKLCSAPFRLFSLALPVTFTFKPPQSLTNLLRIDAAP